jgi:hypothetical protein
MGSLIDRLIPDLQKKVNAVDLNALLPIDGYFGGWLFLRLRGRIEVRLRRGEVRERVVFFDADEEYAELHLNNNVWLTIK